MDKLYPKVMEADVRVVSNILNCVPSMALILLVKVQSRVFTAKCSEPQAGVSNGMGEGSDVWKNYTGKKRSGQSEYAILRPTGLWILS